MPIYTPGQRDALHMGVRCLTQEPNTVTWNTLSRVHETTASPMQIKQVRPCITRQLVRQLSVLPIVEAPVFANPYPYDMCIYYLVTVHYTNPFM